MAAIFFTDRRNALQLQPGALEQLGIRVSGTVLSGAMSVFEAQLQVARERELAARIRVDRL